MEIEFATIEDLSAIERIEGECFMNEAWSRAMIESDFFKRSIYLVAKLDDGQVVGYLSMLDLDIEGEILRIAVRKQYRRRGIARALINFIIDNLKTNHYQKLYLEVKSTNIEAIKLYEHMGFEKINIRKNYYAHGEDAYNYVMLLED